MKATKKQDMEDHVDYYIGNDLVPVDVKTKSQNSIWLEYTNVRGNNGWLRGKAKYIVIYIREHQMFYFFLREALLGFMKKECTGRTKNKEAYHMLYTRKGRKDEVMRTTLKRIKGYIIASIKRL